MFKIWNDVYNFSMGIFFHGWMWDVSRTNENYKRWKVQKKKKKDFSLGWRNFSFCLFGHELWIFFLFQPTPIAWIRAFGWRRTVYGLLRVTTCCWKLAMDCCTDARPTRDHSSMYSIRLVNVQSSWFQFHKIFSVDPIHWTFQKWTLILKCLIKWKWEDHLIRKYATNPLLLHFLFDLCLFIFASFILEPNTYDSRW